MSVTHNSLAALFEDTANAIREKFGLTRAMKADDFPSIIRDAVMLPPAFQRCEYIESHGTEWIDTNFTVQNKPYRAVIPIMLLEKNRNQAITGVGVTSGRSSVFAEVYSNKLYVSAADWAFCGNADEYFNKNAVFDYQKKYHDNFFKIDGVVKYSDNAGDNTTGGGTNFLFARRNGSSANNPLTARVYSDCMYYVDDILIRRYVPCYLCTAWNGIPAGTIGLYDLCGSLSSNGTPFYVNEGTGAFTKGPDVA